MPRATCRAPDNGDEPRTSTSPTNQFASEVIDPILPLFSPILQSVLVSVPPVLLADPRPRRVKEMGVDAV